MATGDMVQGFEDLHRLALEFDTAGPLVARDLDKITAVYGHLIETKAKVNAPVDTGALRNSIGTDITRDGSGPGYKVTAETGPAVDYGAHVELGTEVMAPQAYLGPAFDDYSAQYTAACEAAAIPKALQ